MATSSAEAPSVEPTMKKEESGPLTQAEPKNMVEEEREHSAAETCSPATAANDIPPAASDLTKENIVDEAKDGATIKPQSDPEMQEQDRQALPSKTEILEINHHLLKTQEVALKARIIKNNELNKRLKELLEEIQAEFDKQQEEDENIATLMLVLKLAAGQHDNGD